VKTDPTAAFDGDRSTIVKKIRRPNMQKTESRNTAHSRVPRATRRRNRASPPQRAIAVDYFSLAEVV
jgi:hypothetical protein